MPRLRIFIAVALSLAAASAHAQGDPKSQFVDALGQFSLALDGGYGDEGPRLLTSLAALQQSVARWDDAVQAYEAEARRNAPSDPTLAALMHVALGGLYLDRARLADAIREFDDAIALDATRPDTFVLRGLASAAARDVQGATASFKKAFDLDPASTARAYLLGRSLAQAGRTDEARAALHAVVENQKREGADDRAVAASSKFMRFGLVEERSGVEPYFPPAAYAEAFGRLERGDLGRAIAQLKAVAAADVLVAGDASQSYAMRKGAGALREGDIVAALVQVQAAIELYPNRAEPHRVLGLVYAADEQYERAAAELRSAVAIDPKDERARLGLADVLTRAGDLAAAEQSLRDAIGALPASGRAHYVLARLLQRQGRQADALGELERAATFRPLIGLNGVYQAMGAMDAALQRFDAAVDAYSRRVDSQPNDADAHQDLGDTYARLGRDDEALAEFAVVLLLDARRAAALAAIAQVRLRNGQYEEAADTARRAVALDPAHVQARYLLGTALLRLGHTEEGQQALDVFQRLQADTAAARARDLELGGLRREASVSSAAGDHQKAVTLLRRAMEIAPDEMVSHLNLGIALMLAGQPADAIDRFQSALALNGPDDIHQRLADAYARLGQNDDSRRELEIYDRAKQARLQRTGADR